MSGHDLNSQRGINGKPKGLTRVVNGRLEQREHKLHPWSECSNAWLKTACSYQAGPAIAHNDVRRRLIDKAANTGRYRKCIQMSKTKPPYQTDLFPRASSHSRCGRRRYHLIPCAWAKLGLCAGSETINSVPTSKGPASRTCKAKLCHDVKWHDTTGPGWPRDPGLARAPTYSE